MQEKQPAEQIVLPTAIQNTASESFNSGLTIPVTKDNAESMLTSGMRHSSMVIEGTVTAIETEEVIVHPGEYSSYASPYTVEIYTFQDLEVITGLYEEDTFRLRIAPHQKHENWYQYEVGQRYIIFASSSDAVTNPSADIKYGDQGIQCRLDEQDRENIASLNICGYPMENRIGTRQTLIQIIEDRIGLQHAYYNINDLYVHSDNIADIVADSPIVARVVVLKKEQSSELVDLCTCKIQTLYKGTAPKTEEGFLIGILPDEAEEGKEYMLMFRKFGENPSNQKFYTVNAKKNAVIPMTDTERVNEVYAALGIEPEE